MQYECTFLYIVYYKRIVPTLSYPVVCFRTVKDGRCKTKIKVYTNVTETVVQAQVLLST